MKLKLLKLNSLSADADLRLWGLEALVGFPEDTAPRFGGAPSLAESFSSNGGVLFSVPVCCVDSDAATTLVMLDFEDGACWEDDDSVEGLVA